MLYRIFGVLLALIPAVALSQDKVMTLGLQFKPVFSAPLFGTGPETVNDSGFTYVFTPGWGYSAGMVVRKGYTRNLSVEFGINFAARNYRIETKYSGITEKSAFRIVGYEIPFSQLVFIRLGEKMFMNASGGLCVNMFPSDVVKNSKTLYLYAGRNLIFNPSLIANVGFEYRTDRSGYFYIGSSLNRPFVEIYTAAAAIKRNDVILNSVTSKLNGTYLTIDFRYFFHEDPQRRLRKVKNKN